MNDLAAMARAHLPTMAAHLTIRQIAILGTICDEPNVGSTGNIAKGLGLPKPVVTRAIRTFEVLGLATSQQDKSDGRLRVVAPTEAGIQLRASFKSSLP